MLPRKRNSTDSREKECNKESIRLTRGVEVETDIGMMDR
jgi:hypothetical protein